MKTQQPKSNQFGYTLVEILVALIVGSVMIGAASMLLNTQTKLNQKARDLVIANAFAEAKIESIRSAGYLSLSDGEQDLTNEMPAELKGPRSANLTVSTPQTGLKKLDLALSYNDQGQARNENYTTFIGELGVGQY